MTYYMCTNCNRIMSTTKNEKCFLCIAGKTKPGKPKKLYNRPKHGKRGISKR